MNQVKLFLKNHIVLTELLNDYYYSENIVRNPEYIAANNISISSSHESNGNEAQNCSITTIDDISKAFATAITIGEKYLCNFRILLYLKLK